MKNEKEITKMIEKYQMEVARDQQEHAKAERNIAHLKNQMELLVGAMNFKNGKISASKEILEPEKKEAPSIPKMGVFKKTSKKKGSMKKGQNGVNPDTKQPD